MKSTILKTLATSAAGVVAMGSANAAEILVNADIAVSTTWTADNCYNLQKQIYVLPGATLTIEAGTVLASTTGIGGSLAVTRGAQIHVLGTNANPVIMTSTADVATWGAGKDPKTGTWREGANEWGNLTIMGNGYISENGVAGNVATPNAANRGNMEGLVAAFPGDPNVQYGGGNDDDDSGTIHYLSLRYGGRVIGLNNELNGLSLGGVGRGTDIHHVEVSNNVDDGIEIWGGCVNLKYFTIWNVGDDSLDIDQGWRGKGQFGLIVQGHSADDSQGSGVGDNAVETDGAEDSDWLPVTTTSLYNMTIIGQPVDGDGLTAWRDNARVQYHNSIFMDCGDEVVRFDNLDGDGANGYGHNGTLSWAQTWNTPYSNYPSLPGGFDPLVFFSAQSSGNLAEITESCFFRNLKGNAYTEANARGVFAAGNNNVLIPGFDPVDAPILDIQRGGPVTKGGKTMLPVTFLDPRPANGAVSAASGAPNDGFFSRALYKGAFAPKLSDTWLSGWTAASAYGFVASESIGENYCVLSPNSVGSGAQIHATGSDVVAMNDFTLESEGNPSSVPGIFFAGTAPNSLPFGNGTLCVSPPTQRLLPPVVSSAAGVMCKPVDLTTSPAAGNFVAGSTWYFQGWFRDAAAGGSGFNFTNGIRIDFQ